MTPEQIQTVLEKIDQINNEDPNKEIWDGKEYPKELIYSKRMTEWLHKLEDSPSAEAQIAVHAQHIARWSIPRKDFPMDKPGYYNWRQTLGRFHADKTAEILAQLNADEDFIERVKSILRKEKIKANPDTQLMEDCACLVFIENYFLDFAKGYDEEKLIKIVQKTWKKMSEKAHQAALALDLPPEALAIIGKALA